MMPVGNNDMSLNEHKIAGDVCVVIFFEKTQFFLKSLNLDSLSNKNSGYLRLLIIQLRTVI